VATVVWAPAAIEALDALAAALRAGPARAPATAAAVTSGIALLAGHPLAGQRLRGDLRLLVLSHGATGCVALYRFLPLRDEVRVLAVRSQRGLNFRP
jgi:plasmid stabilization system protein ParE